MVFVFQAWSSYLAEFGILNYIEPINTYSIPFDFIYVALLTIVIITKDI